jgi:hypothetical protein
MAFSSEDSVSIESLVGPMMLDCPIPIAVQGILYAAIEFCERTRCWRNTQTRTVNAGVQNIILSPEDDGLIMDVDAVTFAGNLLSPVTRDIAEQMRLSNPLGTPEVYYRPNPETISLAPAPDASGTLSLVMYLAPLRNATSLPRMLFDLYWDAIEPGALWRLMKIPNRPWSDPAQAGFYKQEFERVTGSYSARAGKDGTTIPLRTTPNF